MSEPTAPAPICAGKPYPHAAAVCDNYAYPCAHEGKQYSLDDVAQLISEWPRAAQCHILAFALALPGTLVSDFWRVLWIADAAAHDADRELDLLSELRGQIEATDKPTGARRPPRLYRQGPGHHAEPRRGGSPWRSWVWPVFWLRGASLSQCRRLAPRRLRFSRVRWYSPVVQYEHSWTSELGEPAARADGPSSFGA